MFSVPAICLRCGFAFPSGIGLGPGVRGASLIGNIAGPCPRCGLYGFVPSGVYQTIDGAMRVISDPAAAAEDVRRLILILEQEQARSNPDPKRVAERIEDEAPTVRGIRRYLPRTSGELAGWIRLLIELIRDLAA